MQYSLELPEGFRIRQRKKLKFHRPYKMQDRKKLFGREPASGFAIELKLCRWILQQVR